MEFCNQQKSDIHLLHDCPFNHLYRPTLNIECLISLLNITELYTCHNNLVHYNLTLTVHYYLMPLEQIRIIALYFYDMNLN